MLIDKYDLEVFTPSCEPGAERFSAIAHLHHDIREVFPYLNAILRGAVYEPKVPSLQWRKAGHYIVFQPNQIAVSNMANREVAIKEVEEVIALINRTWEKRDKIEPNYKTRRRPTGFELYKLLPRINCKICGETSCFVFANKLAVGQVQLEACIPLFKESQYTAQREQLVKLLDVDMPAIWPRR